MNRVLPIAKFLAVVLVAACLIALPSLMFAQTVNSGDVTGTVTDPQGAVVSGATVTLTSAADGHISSTTTNGSGLYRFSFLRVGDYKMSVTSKGFKSVNQTVTVGIGQVLNVSVKLELGAATEILEVTGAAPLLQTENADESTTYNETQLKALPAPGGDITSYAYTAPGVVVSNGAGYGNFSANGLPSTSNLFTVNGNDYMDPYLNLNNSGASNLTLGSNELSEVTVVENGYTADYGRQASAQLNAATKSGTNAFHGNATYGYNGSILNANDWFSKAFELQAGQANGRPHAVNNSYAGSVGGPIIKNKLFFFADYEALRMILPGVSGGVTIPTPAFASYVLTQVPSTETPFYQSIFNLYAGAPGGSNAVPTTQAQDPNMGCGDFSQRYNGNDDPTMGPVYNNPQAQAAGFGNLGTATAPIPGQACSANFASNSNNLITEWIFAGSVDYDINSNDHLKGRYQMDRGVQATGTDPINSVFNATSIQPEYNGQIIETHSFNSTTVNNLIVSGAWYKALFGPPSFAAAVATFPTTINFGNTASTFSALGGADNAYPQGRIVTQVQIRDNFSKIIGGHDLKIGVDYRKNLVSDYSALAGTSGLLGINSTNEFVNGMTGSFNGTGGSGYSAAFTNLGAVKIKLYNVGAYMQDQWKVTSKLSLTMGVRVDRTANPSCATDCFTRMNGPFTNIAHDATIPYNQTIVSGLKYAFPDVEKAVFSPRFGFAYSVSPNTVVRGGFGIFDDEFPATAVDRSLTNTPAVGNFGSSGASGVLLAPLPPGNTTVYSEAAASNTAFQTGFASGLTLADLDPTDCAVPPPVPVNCGQGAGPNYYTIGNKLLNPKFAEWNLEIQRQLGSKYSVSVNYVGNHGYDLMTVNTWLNIYCTACAPGTTFGGLIGTTQTDPRFNEISNLTNDGFSSYNGVTATFKMQPTHGFSGQFNYTYGHDRDTCSNNCLEPFVANTLVSLRYQSSPILPGSAYGNSDYDIRHNFNLNYVYQTPSHWSNSLMNHAVGGWTIGGTMFFHSGLPWSPVDTAKRADFAQQTVFLGLRTTTPLATFGGNGAVVSASCGEGAAQAFIGSGGAPCSSITNFAVGANDFGNSRNSLRGPGFFDSDISVLKNFKIGERLGFAIGATAFDVLNHQNFDLPVNSIRSGAFGMIESTIGTNTNPYGAFFGVPLNGRILQINAKMTF